MARLPKNKIPVSISIPIDLLAELDDCAYYENKARSEFVIEAVREKIKKMKEEN